MHDISNGVVCENTLTEGVTYYNCQAQSVRKMAREVWLHMFCSQHSLRVHTLWIPRFAFPEELLFWPCVWVSVTVITVFRDAAPAKLAVANRLSHEFCKSLEDLQASLSTQSQRASEYDRGFITLHSQSFDTHDCMAWIIPVRNPILTSRCSSQDKHAT